MICSPAYKTIFRQLSTQSHRTLPNFSSLRLVKSFSSTSRTMTASSKYLCLVFCIVCAHMLLLSASWDRLRFCWCLLVGNRLRGCSVLPESHCAQLHFVRFFSHYPARNSLVSFHPRFSFYFPLALFLFLLLTLITLLSPNPTSI